MFNRKRERRGALRLRPHYYVGPCLLPCLHPVRLCLHPFLTDEDAARLMRASSSTTLAVLPHYSLTHEVFQFSSARAMKQTLSLYDRYELRVTKLRLGIRFTAPLLDDATGRSRLPASLVSLWIGREWQVDSSNPQWRAQAGADSEEEEEKEEEGTGDLDEQSSAEDAERLEAERRIELVEAWDVRKFNVTHGAFSQPLTPGALPHGLRYLQLNNRYDQPFQQGSLPSTLEVLQLGRRFSHQLQPGHLPASLTHLIFAPVSYNRHYHYDKPLLAGVLPAGLKRLQMGSARSHIHPGALPPQLEQLSFGSSNNQPVPPGLIPSSVRFLRLSGGIVEPLQAGSIPHGVVHLNVGCTFDQPISPGVLPSSLRELVLGEQFNEPLTAGSLPDGWRCWLFACQRSSVTRLHRASYPLVSRLSACATTTAGSWWQAAYRHRCSGSGCRRSTRVGT